MIEIAEEKKTRKITGPITAWAREFKTIDFGGITIFRVGLLIKEEWHNITSDSEDRLKSLQEEAPINSEVEFEEIQKGEYWNFVAGSFKVLKKGDGIRKRSGFKGGYSESFEAKRTALNCATAIVSNMIHNEKGQPLTDESAKAISLLVARTYEGFHNLLKPEFNKENSDEEEEIKEEKV